MEEPKASLSHGPFSLEPGRTTFFFVPILFLMLLGACETCVTGTVSQEGTAPLEGAEGFTNLATARTDPTGLYRVPAFSNQDSYRIQAVHPVDGGEGL